MDQLEGIVAKLRSSQFGLLRAADAVIAEQWQSRPSETVWSAAEVTCHLMSVERAVLGAADRVSQRTPMPAPFLRRWHLPVKLAEVRVFRLKTPIPIDEEMLREKEEMLAELREVRERTLAFLEETRGRDLSVYKWPHPFLGLLDSYDWMRMIAGHEVRHAKQLREIAAKLPRLQSKSLPKAVASLQK
jgi:DinB family protein